MTIARLPDNSDHRFLIPGTLLNQDPALVSIASPEIAPLPFGDYPIAFLPPGARAITHQTLLQNRLRAANPAAREINRWSGFRRPLQAPTQALPRRTLSPTSPADLE